MTMTEKATLRQDDGIWRAVQHAGEPWVDYATRYVYCYLAEHRELFCDEVWAAGLVRPESPRAFGQIVKNALAAGWMEPTGNVRKSANSNMSLRMVYRSLIYTTPLADLNQMELFAT